MGINVNVKRRFKVNGKEYNSIEEMPDDVREAFKRAMSLKASSTSSSKTLSARITVNGKEYASIDEVPLDMRQLYEKAIKAAEGGSVDDIKEISGMLKGSDASGGRFHEPVHTPLKVEPSFSPRVLGASILIAVLIALFYILLR